jgi:hypothetical protein
MTGDPAGPKYQNEEIGDTFLFKDSIIGIGGKMFLFWFKLGALEERRGSGGHLKGDPQGPMKK